MQEVASTTNMAAWVVMTLILLFDWMFHRLSITAGFYHGCTYIVFIFVALSVVASFCLKCIKNLPHLTSPHELFHRSPTSQPVEIVHACIKSALTRLHGQVCYSRFIYIGQDLDNNTSLNLHNLKKNNNNDKSDANQPLLTWQVASGTPVDIVHIDNSLCYIRIPVYAQVRVMSALAIVTEFQGTPMNFETLKVRRSFVIFIQWCLLFIMLNIHIWRITTCSHSMLPFFYHGLSIFIRYPPHFLA